MKTPEFKYKLMLVAAGKYFVSCGYDGCEFEHNGASYNELTEALQEHTLEQHCN